MYPGLQLADTSYRSRTRGTDRSIGSPLGCSFARHNGINRRTRLQNVPFSVNIFIPYLIHMICTYGMYQDHMPNIRHARGPDRSTTWTKKGNLGTGHILLQSSQQADGLFSDRPQWPEIYSMFDGGLVKFCNNLLPLFAPVVL